MTQLQQTPLWQLFILSPRLASAKKVWPLQMTHCTNISILIMEKPQVHSRLWTHLRGGGGSFFPLFRSPWAFVKGWTFQMSILCLNSVSWFTGHILIHCNTVLGMFEIHSNTPDNFLFENPWIVFTLTVLHLQMDTLWVCIFCCQMLPEVTVCPSS